MRYSGVWGQVLRVDLTAEKYRVESLPEKVVEDYLGGNGLGAKVLWGEVPPGVEPLSPGNKLIVSTGPLNGTAWPCSGRTEFIAKSPLTGIYGDSNAGGYFGAELHLTGYDAIILEGKASKPIYLVINDEQVSFRDARQLWGMTTSFTEKLICEELHDNDVKVACIGPAGENLVKYALIQCSYSRHAARAGMGTVMGSKNLKAIAVRGTHRVPISDQARFKDAARKAFRAIMANKYTPGMREYGTAGLVIPMSEIGRLPTKNHQLGHFVFSEDIGADNVKNAVSQRAACFRCPIRCDKVVTVDQGEFAGTTVGSVEYETLCSLGSQVYVHDLPAVFKANQLCDDLGMDTISVGVCIAFAMELVQRGILTNADCDGLDMSWGNSFTLLTLIEKISRREGFGALLAEGVRSASRAIGGYASRYAMEVKGLEIPCQDGRAQQSMGLAHATANRGADHLKGFPTMDETGYVDEARERYGEEYLPEIIDGTSSRYKAMLVKDGEDFCAVIDSLGICKFGTLFPPAVYWDQLHEGVVACTGMDMGEEDFKRIGERIYNLQRCYNILHGISRKDDRLPDRFIKEKSPSGRARGLVVDLDTMLEDYYRLRNWDARMGYPTKKKLLELGLSEVVAAIPDIH